MATITLLVLQGLERGQRFDDLKIPVTIGREEENTIQLNDERISRCHVKIQQDAERIILTDLESTNGTRVNGLPMQMTVLRPGDLISLGRCVLLFGSREEIRKHCHELHRRSLEAQCFSEEAASLAQTGNLAGVSGTEKLEPAEVDTIGLFDEHGQPVLPFPGGRPPLPQTSAFHARSELADLLAYFHAHILQVLESRGLNSLTQATAKKEQPLDFARIPWPLWYQLIDLESDLAQYLREIPEPD